MHYYQPLNEDIIDVLQDEQDEELEKSTSEVVKGDDTQSPDDFKVGTTDVELVLVDVPVLFRKIRKKRGILRKWRMPETSSLIFFRFPEI